MMKLICSGILILICVKLLNAQVIYFSERYDFFYVSEVAWNVIEIDSGYYVVGGVRDSATDNLSIGWMYLDYNGNLIFKKSYGKDSLDYYPGYSGSLIKTFNGNYALCGGSDSTGNALVVLYYFNAIGDTLWVKQYDPTGSSFDTGYQCKQTNDSGFILIGATGANDDILLLKTDSLGNLQWQKTYGGPGIEYGFTVDVCKDGGYILGGYRVCGFKCQDNYIIKTDSLGNEQWDTIFGGTYEDGPAHVLQLADGGYIVGTRLTDSQPTSSTPYSRLNILRLDSSGSAIWDKTYGPIRFGTNPWNINLDQDSNLVVTGNTSDINKHIMGLIAKISLNGDSLWYREYDIGKVQSSQNYLRHTVPTSDGGYISAGFVTPVPPDTGTQDMWVMKLDSCGCAIPYCDLACSGDTTGVEEKAAAGSGQLKIYPNPTTGHFYIESNFSLPAVFKLYDIFGREVSDKIIYSNDESIETNTLHSGIYAYRITDQSGRMYSGKLLVER